VELGRPRGLDDDTWRAIQQSADRLERVQVDKDHALVVGAAKELVETIAKVVLTTRGETVASGAKMNEVVSRAHTSLDRQPGPDLARDSATRQMADGAKRIAIALGELRNAVGTGHGRAVPADALEEHAAIGARAAWLWSNWALKRLEHLLAGDPAALVKALASDIFRAGELARRLEQANLGELEEPDQRSIGLAVAHRAMSGTFTVQRDGIEACAKDQSLERWPVGYRAALIEGLFIDRAGHVSTDPYLLRYVPPIARPMPRPDALFRAIHDRALEAEWSADLKIDPDLRTNIRATLETSADQLPVGAIRVAWCDLADIFGQATSEGPDAGGGG